MIGRQEKSVRRVTEGSQIRIGSEQIPTRIIDPHAQSRGAKRLEPTVNRYLSLGSPTHIPAAQSTRRGEGCPVQWHSVFGRARTMAGMPIFCAAGCRFPRRRTPFSAPPYAAFRAAACYFPRCCTPLFCAAARRFPRRRTPFFCAAARYFRAAAGRFPRCHTPIFCGHSVDSLAGNDYSINNIYFHRSRRRNTLGAACAGGGYRWK